jgi:hypothetical protein
LGNHQDGRIFIGLQGISEVDYRPRQQRLYLSANYFVENRQNLPETALSINRLKSQPNHLFTLEPFALKNITPE